MCFLSPADHKCAELPTYWQFFYYRPPGKFRWTSVNHFDKHREISLKCDVKNISLSLYIYIYIYHTLDNRFLKILVVIGHVCIYWSKVAEGFSVFNAVLYLNESITAVLLHVIPHNCSEMHQNVAIPDYRSLITQTSGWTFVK